MMSLKLPAQGIEGTNTVKRVSQPVFDKSIGNKISHASKQNERYQVGEPGHGDVQTSL